MLLFKSHFTFQIKKTQLGKREKAYLKPSCRLSKWHTTTHMCCTPTQSTQCRYEGEQGAFPSLVVWMCSATTKKRRWQHHDITDRVVITVCVYV